jgi:enterobacterial common antigen flippase
LDLVRTGHGNFGALLQTMATRVSIFALNLGCGVITARGLGAHGRGMLAALATWPQFIAYLLTFGIINSFMFNVKAHPEDKRELFGAAIVLSLIAGMAATAVGVVLMPRLLAEYSSEEVLVARIFMAVAPAILLALTMQTAAEAASDFRGANIVRGLSVAATFVALVLFLTAGLSPAGAAACYLLPQIPLTLWLFVRLRRHYRPTLSRFRETARRLAAYGLQCYPHEFITAAAAYVGQALVVTLLQPAAVGWFTVSLSIARLLEIFYATVAAVLLPASAARSAAEVVGKTTCAARLTVLFMAAFAMPLFVLLPGLLPLVYGRSFTEAVPIARLLLLEGMLSGAVWVLMQGFLALGRPTLAATIQASAVAASIVLLLRLAPIYGAVGAAKVLLAVAMAKLILAVGLYRVALRTRLRQLNYCRADFAYLGALLRR